MTPTNNERAAFEAWASAPPREFDLRVFNKNDLWPGQYWAYETQCAWEGYQAGRASLAANAPAAEPGRWYALSADGMATLCADREDAEKTAADSNVIFPKLGPYRAVQLYTAPPAPTEQWVSVEERLPEPGKAVLLDIGKKTPIRAMRAAKYTVLALDDDTGWSEYDEESDTYYCPEGWYEWNEHEEVHWRVYDKALNWRHLPAPPDTAANGANHG